MVGHGRYAVIRYCGRLVASNVCSKLVMCHVHARTHMYAFIRPVCIVFQAAVVRAHFFFRLLSRRSLGVIGGQAMEGATRAALACLRFLCASVS